MSEFGNTLIVTGGGLGDTLFHLPFINSIQQRLHGNPVFLACKKAREIDELFSEIDEIHSVLPIARNQDISGKANIGRLRRLTREAGIQTAFIFHKSVSISFAIMMAGVGNRFGYYLEGGMNRFFLNRGICVPRSVPTPEFMSYASMVMDSAGIPYDYNDVCFRQPDRVIKAAFERLGLVDRSQMIALGVNASAEFKQWGSKRFSAIAERLLDSFTGRILIFGAGDVRQVAEDILAGTARPDRFIDLTAKDTPLNHSHALLQCCDFYVGNDSFGLNLAAMSSIPAVGIFGQDFFFSYSDWIKPVISKSSKITGVDPNMVWEEISRLMAQPPRNS